MEMVGTVVHQLTRNLTDEQIKTAGFDTYFVDRTAGVYPTAASGFPCSQKFSRIMAPVSFNASGALYFPGFCSMSSSQY